MSGVGFWELVILLLIGLIVLGPERLPRVANQLGTWLGQARRMTRMMKRQLEDELNLEKDLGIRPARLSTPPSTQPPAYPPRAHDDTYSPAHPAGSAGTGVGPEPSGTPETGGAPETGEDGRDKQAAGEHRQDGDDASSVSPAGDDAVTKKPQ